MATSPELDRVIGIMKAIRSKPTVDIHEARAVLDQAFGQYRPAPDVTVFEIEADGVPCQWITAPDSLQNKLIIYFHGGAYAAFSPTTHQDLISRLLWALIIGWHRSMFSQLWWKTPLLLTNGYWGTDLSLRISS